MALKLEEIRKLPPRERIEKLKEFEEQEKKRIKEEETKLKQEEEELIKKSIDEIAKEDSEAEEEELKQKEKPKETLEEIAEEAKTEKKKDDGREYQIIRQYQERDSHKPPTELYGRALELRETFEQKGYLNAPEKREAEILRGAFYQQVERGYFDDGSSSSLKTGLDNIFEQMKNPLKRNYR